ncbi:hypothetical protein GGX14DRAFT_660649 [Mycena pura]|uniref:Uncharacterized protein n=1 Tax=Mycena pura TaxID=153505 RepID=A0AAD6YB45_9AGAR|nr:hypothetical protein GGX14DRAFT_660649 [Mycena pura]
MGYLEVLREPVDVSLERAGVTELEMASASMQTTLFLFLSRDAAPTRKALHVRSNVSRKADLSPRLRADGDALSSEPLPKSFACAINAAQVCAHFRLKRKLQEQEDAQAGDDKKTKRRKLASFRSSHCTDHRRDSAYNFFQFSPRSHVWPVPGAEASMQMIGLLGKLPWLPTSNLIPVSLLWWGSGNAGCPVVDAQAEYC